MPYTTIDRPSDYFRVKTYSGSSSDGNAITWDETDNNMQPDWLWLKNRTAAQEHWLADSVRGTGKFLESNSSNAESSDGASGLASFDTNGFTLNNSARTNRNTMVGWGWKAGTSFSNDASATSVGSIDSAGSVSTTAGFSIIGWTGTNANGTIAHGLGSVPKMIIIRRRESSSTWVVYHNSTGNTGRLALDENSAFNSNSTFFNNTSPTSTTFSVGSDGGSNGSTDNYIAYCFAEKKGYSKFGSYTGNGNADGTFVYTGFKPAWGMFKRTDNTADWYIYDNKRNTFNVLDDRLEANNSDAEAADGGDGNTVDYVSNGFKLRGSGGSMNDGTFIYMAFSEAPFVSSSGVPTTAR